MNRPAQQIRFCTSKDGTRIAYAVCGEGPPLVRAGHGTSHLEYEWECLVWRPWLELLSRRHTLIRYDMRETGLSDRDVECSFERYVEDLAAVVQAAEVKRFELLGMTGGGALAVAHAARHPDQVSHLVLYGTPASGRMVRSTTPQQVEETEFLLKAIELGWEHDDPSFRQAYTSGFLPDGTAEQFRSFNEFMRSATSAASAARLMRAWFMTDVRQLAPQVRCPTLVLHARGDLRVPFDEGRSLAALIPGARFVPLDSRNHFLLEQEPAWQQLITELDGFLKTRSTAPVGSLDGLTAREHAVLEVLVQGLDTDVMAERLGMSEKTVRNHLSTIFSKLGVANRVQAIVWAREKGVGNKSAG